MFLLFAGCRMEKDMLYHPGHYGLRDARYTAQQTGLKLWPEDGAGYMGYVSEEPPDTSVGTIVVFHGNAGLAGHRGYYVAALERLGYRVVLAEYPGYGGRKGALSEASFVADGLKVAAQARSDFGGPLYLWGESLGCGVAAALAADDGLAVEGVVMLTPWDSLMAVAKSHFSWLPVKALTKDRYDSVANLAGYEGPVAVLLSEHDEVIPPTHARNLYQGLPEPKRLWVFDGAGHNTWPTGPRGTHWPEVMSFLERGGAGSSTDAPP